MRKTLLATAVAVVAVVLSSACSSSDDPLAESSQAVKKCKPHKHDKKHDCDDDDGGVDPETDSGADANNDDANDADDGFDGNISDDGSRPDAPPEDAPPDAPPLNNSCRDDDGKDLFTAAHVRLYGGDTTCTTETVLKNDTCFGGDQLGEWVCEDQAENVAPAGQCMANHTASLRFFSCKAVCIGIGATTGDCVSDNAGLGRCACSI